MDKMIKLIYLSTQWRLQMKAGRILTLIWGQNLIEHSKTHNTSANISCVFINCISHHKSAQMHWTEPFTVQNKRVCSLVDKLPQFLNNHPHNFDSLLHSKSVCYISAITCLPMLIFHWWANISQALLQIAFFLSNHQYRNQRHFM